MGQGAADVIDGEVLLAQGDDPIAEWLRLGRGLRSLGRGEEEVPPGVLTELVDKNTQAPWGVAEAARDLGTRESLHEEGTEGLVLAVGGVGRFEEDASKVR